jgi:hypothetical protein
MRVSSVSRLEPSTRMSDSGSHFMDKVRGVLNDH